jgi:hypothetical protein
MEEWKAGGMEEWKAGRLEGRPFPILHSSNPPNPYELES